LSVASSVSPACDRGLSEQSENTLDSDSKLSLSFQSKLVRSPPNTSSITSSVSQYLEKDKHNTSAEDHVSSGHRSEGSPAAPPVLPRASKSISKNRPNNAEQDMFSEHFDVSFTLYSNHFSSLLEIIY